MAVIGTETILECLRWCHGGDAHGRRGSVSGVAFVRGEGRSAIAIVLLPGEIGTKGRRTPSSAAPSRPSAIEAGDVG
jgi:hypothetical protein